MDVNVDAALAHLDALLEAAAPGYADSEVLARAARAISVGYTETRAIDADAAASVAYLAHFGPRAVVAMARAISSLPEASPGHVLDLGAGSGASALAWAFAGAKRLTLVERSGPALSLATRLLARTGAEVGTQRSALENISPVAKVDHVSAAFVVGELGDEVDGAALLERAAPGAIGAVLVDAGDHPRARRLQHLREALLLRADVAILGPCPHTDACPALVRERDWCHDRVKKLLPERLARFARRVGRDDVQMSLSWLTWGKDTRPARADGVIVLGEPRREKGRLRIPVCGPRGVRFVQILQRDRAAFRALADIERGTRLPAPPPETTTDTWGLKGEAADAIVSMITEMSESSHIPPNTDDA